MEKKKVVVIGGGFTGSYCAKNLQENFDLTLIDTKEYFEYTPGILRTIVQPSHVRKIQVQHEDYLTKGKFIKGKAISISDTHIRVKTKKIPFDYAIIASGSKYSPPIKEQDLVIATRAKTLSDQFHRLHNAKDVLIIGGGLVGVELAAEILDHYKNKSITIVHSKPTLIDRNHKNSIDYAHNFLEKRGVKIILNEKVLSKSGKIFKTNKDTKIKADKAFICSGIKPNYSVLKKHFSSCISEKNHVKTNEFFQLDCNKKIFVGGDINAEKEEKTAQAAEKHAQLIVNNINALNSNKPMKTYKSERRPMLISLGKYNGIFEMKGFVIKGLIPAFLKSFVEFKTMIRYR